MMSRGALLSVSTWLAVAIAAPAAHAASAWRIDALANSTVAPGGTLDYALEIRNAGDVDLDGSQEAVTLNGTLPAGLSFAAGPAGWTCSSVGQDFSCQSTDQYPTLAHDAAYWYRRLLVQATADPSASGVKTASFSIEGGDPSDGDPTTPSAATVAQVTATDLAPAFGIAAFDARVSGDAAGTPFRQAAGHPFAATTDLDENTYQNPDPLRGDLTPVEGLRDVDVDLPPGFFGDPHGLAQCTAAQLANVDLAQAKALCPPASQVGTILLRALGTHMLFGPVPVFNMVPPVNAPARLGFNFTGTVVTMDISVRSASDYGLTAHLRDISEGLGVAGTSLTLWGVPSDPSHDAERACPGQVAPWESGPQCQSGAPAQAFLRNPTSCTAPGIGLATTVRMDSWLHPGAFVQKTIPSHLAGGYPLPQGQWGADAGPNGCDAVPFDPALTAAPSSGRAAAPTGLSVDLTLPQNDDPRVNAESDLRSAVVRLPQGVRLNPSGASGLAGCSPAQIGLHDEAAAACPDGSRIGTVSVKTPALNDPLTGAVYLATPHDNPFGSLVALYLVASGHGVTLKLPGRADLDPATGQMTATFDDNPQLPFSDLHLQFKEGSRAPLVTPSACGAYTTHADLTGWNGKAVAIDAPFTIDQGCGDPQFAPTLDAGVTNPVAGRSSAFTLRVQRGDDDSEIKSITTVLPKGLLANVGSIPAGAQIGTVTVGAGAGPSPFYIDKGKVFLTGPYNGAPFGLDIQVPAVAGPFDLGTVDVKAALNVDPVTTQATVIADPLPRYLQGIPVLAKDVRVTIDRPGFIVNPTSCAEQQVGSAIASFDGATASPTTRFQVGDCASLDLAPSLALSLTGKGQTTDGKHPGVVATLTQKPGQANLRRVQVTLPHALALDVGNAAGLCEFAPGSKPLPDCPASSIVGHATATTPLLNGPLTGPVYFVKNERTENGRQIKTLPKIVAALTGQNGLRLTLTGTSDVDKHSNLVTTFDNIPDAAVRGFMLTIDGGKHGILAVSGTDICKATQRAAQQIDGQNGKIADAMITVSTPCGLQLLSGRVTARAATLKVGGLGAGKLTVSGRGIRTTSRTLKGATVATITARRTRGRPHRIRVTFDPAGPAKPTSRTVTVR